MKPSPASPSRPEAERPAVHFVGLPESSSPDEMTAAALRLWKALRADRLIPKSGLVAIKQHMGEEKAKGVVPPAVARAIGEAVKQAGGKPFLTDSNTLYTGRRHNAVDHLEVARENGFSHETLGFPVLIADGLRGENQVTLKRQGGVLRAVHLAGAGYMADAAIVLTHVTGHVQAGMGAAIKNVAMGFAGPGGKMHQHHNTLPIFDAKACTACGRCARHCPTEAIRVEAHAVLDRARCVGCCECFNFCRFGAVAFEWSETSANLQKKMAEYCLAFHREKADRIAYFNFLTRITRQCDCMGGEHKALPDIGVLASRDPVAVDAASLELVNRHFGHDVFRKFWPERDPWIQVRHGEALGLGSTRYDLIPLTAAVS